MQLTELNFLSTTFVSAVQLLSYGDEAGDSVAEETSDITGEIITPVFHVPFGLPLKSSQITNTLYVRLIIAFIKI